MPSKYTEIPSDVDEQEWDIEPTRPLHIYFNDRGVLTIQPLTDDEWDAAFLSGQCEFARPQSES